MRGKHLITGFIGLMMLVILCLEEAAAPAPPMETPVNVQMPIFFNVLTFDRNLKSRVGEEIVWGVLYQEKYRESFNIKNEIESFIKKSQPGPIEGIHCRFISINIGDLGDLKAVLENEKVDIVYVTPLRAVDITELGAITQELKITSFTGVPEYCREGIAVGLSSTGGRPVIMINLGKAVEEGADFGSRLLKLVSVIETKPKRDK